MNERIRQLAEQAGCKVMDDGEWYIPSAAGLEKIVYTQGTGLEKFAELIVKECIKLTMNEKLRYSSSYNKKSDWTKQLMMIHCATSMDNYKILLQEHFGVEE